MKISRTTRRKCGLAIVAAMGAALGLAGCSSKDSASEMTSFSSKESKSETPVMFTIPQDQMAHVQVVTVEPSKLTRVLRLSGNVSFNAFKTTPVITQVGGPVSRILAVPGEHVHAGQPLLTVSSRIIHSCAPPI